MELEARDDGVLILNDAYNANPDSMAVGLDALMQLTRTSREKHAHARAIAVLGDMLELGPEAAELHRDLGRRAAEAGVAEVVAVGGLAAEVAAGAAAGGALARVAERDIVAGSLTLTPGDVVLVKGSRGVGLEKVAAELIARDGGAS
jgi:UDP-N-acetylmuramoyl-tripeptide--D-alanyl-D-alanine ligase